MLLSQTKPKNLFDNMLIASQQASAHVQQLCPKHKGQKKRKNYIKWMQQLIVQLYIYIFFITELVC